MNVRLNGYMPVQKGPFTGYFDDLVAFSPGPTEGSERAQDLSMRQFFSLLFSSLKRRQTVRFGRFFFLQTERYT